MVDAWLVVAIVVVTLAVTGGIKISFSNIHIGNRTNEKDDD